MKLLFIDGALSPGNIWRELAQPMKEKYPQAEFVYAHWFDLERILTMNNFDVVAGHSLGGDTAVRYCERLKKVGRHQPELLMLLAPRYQTDVKEASNWDWVILYDSAQVFTAPNSVTHCFWTYGPFCSAPCTGAVENVRIGLPYWHGTVPAAPQVQKCLSDFLAKLKELI